MKIKSCAGFKAVNGPVEGEFEAIVSVFGNVDRHGDVVLPGAFERSLKRWKASGDPIPVLWSHRMDDPRYSIGAVKEAEELEPFDRRIPEWAGSFLKEHGGLWVHAEIDSSDDASDVAKAARSLLKKRLVKQFSYAYDVVQGGWGTAENEEAYELRELDLFEVSPTQIGANGLTELIAAKADDMLTQLDERGLRGMSTKALREVAARINAALESRNTKDDETSATGPVNDEEPDGVKSEEPSRHDDRLKLVLAELITIQMETMS